MDSCFKLHGYLDWYKEFKEKNFDPKAVANVQMESPFDFESDEKGKQSFGGGSSNEFDVSLVNVVCQEVLNSCYEG